MTPVPANPKIYHITHVDNLPAIIAAGELRSDALMVATGGPATMIGMSHIKTRRLHQTAIECLDGTMVGACVPFYFCPRSVMLFIVNRGSSDISYTGGQQPIVHLEADLNEVVTWLDVSGLPWAFSLSSAATSYVEFRAEFDELNQVDWEAVRATYWGEPGVRDRKQAEFLVKDTFPWHLFQTIGVHSTRIAEKVTQTLDVAQAHGGSTHRPMVEYRPGWYY